MMHNANPRKIHLRDPEGGLCPKPFVIVILSAFLLFPALTTFHVPAWAEVSSNHVLSLARQMRSSFQAIDNYSCEVENIYFFGGFEEKRYHLKFYFKRKDLYRMDFVHPFEGMTIFYRGRDQDFTVRPVRAVSAFTLLFSITNPLFTSPSGQRLDQTSIEHFLDFLFKNLRAVKQGNPEWKEDDDRIVFWFWGMDYIEERLPEKYLITISKKFWLPLRFERYDIKGIPQEITVFSSYRINESLSEEFFTP